MGPGGVDLEARTPKERLTLGPDTPMTPGPRALTFRGMVRSLLVAIAVLTACADQDPHELVDCPRGQCEVACLEGDQNAKDPTCTFELDGRTQDCTNNTAAYIWPVAFDGQRGCCFKRVGVEFKTYEWHVCE